MGYELSMEDVLSDENLQDAMDSFRDKRDSNGVDGVKLSELGEYWTLNGEKIKRELSVSYTHLTLPTTDVV